ncbi:hypothetical protein AOLI_G00311250 [Acnodon oligacanthus]
MQFSELILKNGTSVAGHKRSPSARLLKEKILSALIRRSHGAVRERSLTSPLWGRFSVSGGISTNISGDPC